LEKVPAEHDTHAERPVLLAKLPGAHGACSPAWQNEATGHGSWPTAVLAPTDVGKL
jgi:hypothetical protein